MQTNILCLIELFVCLLVGCLCLWYINIYRLFNVKSIFIQINSSIQKENQFSMSMQFKCQKDFYFKQFKDLV